jgi:opacity protein-like surface antigen
MTHPRWTCTVVSVALLALGIATFAAMPVASAFDPEQTFHPGAFALSVEGGGGARFNTEGMSEPTNLKMWNAGIRLSMIPWGPAGPSVLRGALEVGLEPFFQRYTDPVQAGFAGLAAVGRYHFLALGRVVPYAEVFLSAGGTNLKIREIDSDFTFLLQGGLGLSVFLTDHVAMYGGYRLQHVSNGNTSQPNRGFESHMGVAGVSYYFK